MFPRLIEIPIGPGLTIYSFGFMVAVAILFASWLTSLELKRRQEIGQLGPIKVKRKPRKSDRKGDRKNRKSRNAQVEVVKPADFVGTLTIIAAVAGIAGSKLFHILENLDQFAADPAGMIFSRGGLTFYGGLIVAAVAVAWYARKKGIPVPVLADATAPGLMIAYGIGRIGCHLAGDGDWGIASDLSNKPGWLPDWLWSETYPNNILGIDLPGDGVFPTPLYEFAMTVALFAVLWGLRKHPFRFGWLFALYFVLNGIERFLIEQIRVNNTFDLLGMTVTQAEVIAVAFIVIGLAGLAVLTRRRDAAPLAPSSGADPAGSDVSAPVQAGA